MPSLYPIFLVFLALFDEGSGSATLPDLLERMSQRNQARTATLARYTCLRHYSLTNFRFHKQAEMMVRMTYTRPGLKTFEVLSQKGPAVLCDRVLRKMFEAEAEASEEGLRQKTQISPRNYSFKLLGSEQRAGRLTYILAAAPKYVNKFAMRGQVWVDAEDSAITRVEVSPAQNPSVLIRNTNVVQQYAKQGPYWLPEYSHSTTDSLLFGHTEVSVVSSDYRMGEAAGR